MRIRVAVVPAVVGVVAALLAGCTQVPTTIPSASPSDNGVAALSAEEILDKTTAALEEAGSYTLSGEVPGSTFGSSIADIMGEKASYLLEVNGEDLAAEGSNATETLKIRKIGTDLYANAPADVLSVYVSEPTLIAAGAGTWLKLPAATPFVAGFTAVLTSPLTNISTTGLEKGTTSTIGTTPVISLITAQGTLYVATVGEPVPVRLEFPLGATQLAIDVTNVGSTPAPQAPPAGETIDVTPFLGIVATASAGA